MRVTIRRFLVLLLSLILMPGVAVAEDILTSKDIPKDVAKPFDWELGDKAVIVKGNGIAVTASFPQLSAEKWKPYAEYDVNAQYSYDGTDRIGDVTLGPAITRSTLKPNLDADCENQPFKKIPATLWTVFGHLRGRYADVDKSKDVTDYRTAVLAGAGGRVRFYPDFLDWWTILTNADVEMPTMSVTWYNALTEESPDTSLEADQLQARFEAEIPLPIGSPRKVQQFSAEHREFLRKNNCTDEPVEAPKRPYMVPLRLSIDLKYSQATEGGNSQNDGFLADVALKWLKPDAKIGFALRYKTGNDLGFEYDRAYIASLLLRFAN